MGAEWETDSTRRGLRPANGSNTGDGDLVTPDGQSCLPDTCLAVDECCGPDCGGKCCSPVPGCRAKRASFCQDVRRLLDYRGSHVHGMRLFISCSTLLLFRPRTNCCRIATTLQNPDMCKLSVIKFSLVWHITFIFLIELCMCHGKTPGQEQIVRGFGHILRGQPLDNKTQGPRDSYQVRFWVYLLRTHRAIFLWQPLLLCSIAPQTPPPPAHPGPGIPVVYSTAFIRSKERKSHTYASQPVQRLFHETKVSYQLDFTCIREKWYQAVLLVDAFG